MNEFDLYFVGCSDIDWGATKFLYSQYSHRSSIKKIITESIDRNINVKIFIDSGAWTAFTKGVSIDIDDYINYLNYNDGNFSIAAALDVLPSGKNDANMCAEKSWANYLYMRNNLINKDRIVPVYHQNESLSNLIRMLTYVDDYGPIKYIGIGALANTLDYSIRDSFISNCFDIITLYNPDVKVHAFGMTDLRLLEEYPFSSADSSTYAMAGAMGEILTEFGRVVISINRPDSIKKNSIAGQKLASYIQSFGFTFDELSVDSLARKKFNIKYLQLWESNRKCRYRRNKKRLF